MPCLRNLLLIASKEPATMTDAGSDFPKKMSCHRHRCHCRRLIRCLKSILPFYRSRGAF